MEYIKKTLENGIRVIVAPMPQSKVVTVSLSFFAGTEHETKEKNGIAHVLEHMAFKGTTKRPTAKHVRDEFASMGARSNATTHYSSVDYYATVANENFVKALDILADISLNGNMDPEELEREKGVIIQERKRRLDSKDIVAYETLKKLYYGDTAFGRTQVGTEETIKGITANDLRAYQEAFYFTDNLIITIAGGISETNAIASIENQFKNVIKRKNPIIRSLWVMTPQQEPRTVCVEDKFENPRLIVSFAGFDDSYAGKWALKVLGSVLGGGMSSRLASRIREELSLVYGIGSSYGRAGNVELGRLNIGTETAPDKLPVVIEEAIKECGKLRCDMVSDDELLKVKENMIGNFLIDCQTSMSMASYYEDQYVDGIDILTPGEWVEEIKRVTPNDILTAAKEIFTPERLNVVVVGKGLDETAIKAAVVAGEQCLK